MVHLDQFKMLIHQRLEEIEHANVNKEAQSVELDQTRVGRLSRMDAMQMQQMELELMRRRQREIVALSHALERVKNNEFGECFECGEEINPKRLEIDLCTTLCIQCAEKRESR
ncbi:MAG: TraR/DksA C4-type zinc finger protein [Acidiferrobacterales bacterium]|nr:TraR/DksA C4-type zinc finger protein [Acidiferrobacterales bacterium]